MPYEIIVTFPLLPQPDKNELDLATPEGCKAELTYLAWLHTDAKQCVDQYMVLFRYCLLRGDTDMPQGLHARLCRAFLVHLRSAEIWHCVENRIRRTGGKPQLVRDPVNK